MLLGRSSCYKGAEMTEYRAYSVKYVEGLEAELKLANADKDKLQESVDWVWASCHQEKRGATLTDIREYLRQQLADEQVFDRVWRDK